MLTPVPINYLPSVWNTVEPMIGKYISEPDIYEGTPTIYTDLISGKKTLWVHMVDNSIKFAIITEPVTTDKGFKFLHILNSGSAEGSTKDTLNFQELRQNLESIAKVLGFDGVSAITRPALAKEYKGFKEIGRIFHKRF